MRTEVTTCVAVGCGRDPEGGEAQPRPADPGSLLCRPCRNGVHHRLGRLPQLYRASDGLLNAQSKQVERVSGGRNIGIPLNSSAVEARANVRGFLAAWSQLVVDERDVSAPDRTVPAMAEFLLRHRNWIDRHPAVGEFANELFRAFSRMQRLETAVPIRRITVSRCPEDGCPGELEAVLRPQDARAGSLIRCTHTKEHTWPTERWSSLRPQRRASASLTS
ncbi:hypothetical protein ACIBCA_13870 [Kitasatospora sp. NPDC051170]|uniref:hypothetical protein n=1 Tax=Kitasatospora sp. NPDC051170 TaxID=3364056 RepID=UPI0037BD9E5E